MNEKTKKTIRIVYYALVTLMLVAVAVLMMVACVNIYRTGDHPFTPDVVAAAFDSIAVPTYICLGLLVVGIVLHPLLPTADEADPDRDRAVLGRLTKRVNLALCSQEVVATVRKERFLRLICCVMTVALLAVGAVNFLEYALDFNHFTMENINGSMITAMWVLLPCIGIPCISGIVSAYVGRASMRREIAALKSALPEAQMDAPSPAAKKPVALMVARSAIVVIAIACIVGGLLNNGWADVLTKAINICTECIGLG